MAEISNIMRINKKHLHKQLMIKETPINISRISIVVIGFYLLRP